MIYTSTLSPRAENTDQVDKIFSIFSHWWVRKAFILSTPRVGITWRKTENFWIEFKASCRAMEALLWTLLTPSRSLSPADFFYGFAILQQYIIVCLDLCRSLCSTVWPGMFVLIWFKWVRFKFIKPYFLFNGKHKERSKKEIPFRVISHNILTCFLCVICNNLNTKGCNSQIYRHKSYGTMQPVTEEGRAGGSCNQEVFDIETRRSIRILMTLGPLPSLVKVVSPLIRMMLSYCVKLFISSENGSRPCLFSTTG